MTFRVGIDNNDDINDLLDLVEVYVEELLEEFDTDAERIGALAANIAMSLGVLRQSKSDAEVVGWLNTVVNTWGASTLQ